jgi:peptide/nickel transport system permease protein
VNSATWRYAARRIGQGVVVMWIVATTVFFIFRVLPGDVTSMVLGLETSEAAREALRDQLGLNDPILVQYLRWLFDLVRGDLGTSIMHGGASVTSLVFPAFLRSLELAAVSTAVATVVAVPIGVLAATSRRRWVDSAARVVTTLGFSIPTYVLGIILILVFALQVGVLPPGGYVPFTEDPWRHIQFLVLPVAAVSIVMAARLTRFVRASMLEEIQKDYRRTAIGKGLSRREVFYRHCLRNSLIPLITEAGVNFGLLIGGMVIIEQIFGWPGLGWLMIQSVFGRAFEVVQAAVLLAAAALITINVLVDLAYTRIDPRIKVSA